MSNPFAEIPRGTVLTVEHNGELKSAVRVDLADGSPGLAATEPCLNCGGRGEITEVLGGRLKILWPAAYKTGAPPPVTTDDEHHPHQDHELAPAAGE